jgi:hypothetical protein
MASEAKVWKLQGGQVESGARAPLATRVGKVEIIRWDWPQAPAFDFLACGRQAAPAPTVLPGRNRPSDTPPAIGESHLFAMPSASGPCAH